MEFEVENRTMKNVFVLSTIRIHNGNSAGSARMMNIARALTMEGIKVYLCSSELQYKYSQNNIREVAPNIFLVGKEHRNNVGMIKNILHRLFHTCVITNYLWNVTRLAKSIKGEKVLYLYPTGDLSMELITLLLFKGIYRHKIFCDVNELRRATLVNSVFSKNMIKMVWQKYIWLLDFIKYYGVENLTRHYDGLVVISTNIEHYFGRYNKRLLKIPILSEVSSSSSSSSSPPIFTAGGNFSICFAGMIALKKEGFDIFYEALSLLKTKYKNFELHLYGPINKYTKGLLLTDIPEKFGIKDNIFYHGILAQQNIIKEMRKYHLLVLPRPLNMQTHYGFSTKLSEYMISGVPVLVTAVSDNEIYIKDNYNGFIVKPGDAEAMANKIFKIIENYNKVAHQISINAFDTARKCFNYSNYSSILSAFLFNKSK